MSDTHLYLSLIPQALVGSMLEPEEFGRYYATGTQVHIQGEAIFFEVDPAFRSDDFPFSILEEKCVPGPAGEPKKSVYLSIYRVLSRVPVAALGNLYLVTSDGQTLELQRAPYQAGDGCALHLYQEFCPITPMVASRLEPEEFCRFITDSAQPVHVPRIVFSELMLNGLATDPLHGASDDLPYHNIDHLRDCLQQVNSSDKASKLVLKQVNEGVLYRMVKGGFYVGDQYDFAFYRFPPVEELENQYRRWWRSAQTQPFIGS
jgi:hypothetical protein